MDISNLTTTQLDEVARTRLWLKICQEGQKFFQEGSYVEAEQYFQSALEQSRFLNEVQQATSKNNLAELYRVQGRYADAEPLYHESLALREQFLGEHHPHVGGSLNNLANLCYAQGRYTRARVLYRKALTVWERSLPESDLRIAVCLNNLAVIYRIQSKFPQSESLYKRALKLAETHQGPQAPQVARILSGLALLCKQMGKYKKAEVYLERALEITRGLGDDHPDAATQLINLASVYQAQGKLGQAKMLGSQGRFEAAEPICRQAVEIRKRRLGDCHPEVADAHRELGNLYEVMGRREEALDAYNQAVDIYREACGEDHPELANTLECLAGLLRRLLKHRDAETVEARVRQIRINLSRQAVMEAEGSGEEVVDE
ncbi:MAG: hypothetical protein AMXMBFR33_60720 [Candidatus Xenobia bacterium]